MGATDKQDVPRCTGHLRGIYPTTQQLNRSLNLFLANIKSNLFESPYSFNGVYFMGEILL